MKKSMKNIDIPKKIRKVKISVTIDEDIFEAIEDLAREKKETNSYIVNQIMRQLMDENSEEDVNNEGEPS